MSFKAFFFTNMPFFFAKHIFLNFTHSIFVKCFIHITKTSDTMFTPIEINKDYEIKKIGKDLKELCSIDIESFNNVSIFSFLSDSDLHNFTLYTCKLAIEEGIEKTHQTKMICKRGHSFSVKMHLKYSQGRFAGYIEWENNQKNKKINSLKNPKTQIRWRVIENSK
jgi:hypothetical protein